METRYQTPHIKTELPGPKAKAILQKDSLFVSPSYTRDFPLVVDRGRGCWVEDVDGNTFLDMASGIAVCATGHCHPAILAAIKEQSEKLIHMSGTDFYYPAQSELAMRLSQRLPGAGGGKVFFCNSGAESVECALKLARHRTKRPYLISFFGAFHGRTMGALSLTASKTVHKEGFAPLVPGIHHATYGDLDSIEKLLKHAIPENELAAILVEAIQGEGGYRPAPPGFLRGLREICDRVGALLIMDEVQSGMGRTGKFFAFEEDGVNPDIVTMAKGIASGMPLGACIAQPGIMEWPPGSHASTFGGNPVACAASLATLDLLDEGLLVNAAEMGRHLRSLLEEACLGQKGVIEVRGRGLMQAVEVDTPDHRNDIIARCFEKGLVILGCGPKSVRFCPALVVDHAEIDCAVKIFAEALAETLR
jgi:4-aminobutyrate aminotransferase